MLTDRELIELTVTLLAIAAVCGLIALVVYFVYVKPNFFYGDYVVLSITDVNGKEWWLKNDKGTITFTGTQSAASVLRILNGRSGQKGQIFEGNTFSFELQHPYYGALLTAQCNTKAQDPAALFSTTTGIQVGVTSEGVSIGAVDKGNAVKSGGLYHLSVEELDCVVNDCTAVNTSCNVSGCFFTTAEDATTESGFTTEINCGDAATQQLWKFTKVETLNDYNEYKSEADFLFSN